ncbi:MAG: hypothetical protein AVDCRST_MAG23-1879 [uncultured Sphingosinicella sp.]|uniref:Carboxypeptidase Q n=1 Tax=uncultured Sphingosinicella sp. TaxID=478748 RepID=A0A6J4TYW5_9SPHN|nr:M20/M25/M40 family metallo-hydrolase [uncultured Sphingosinicella sp.]CAA9536017.1 MAG: hypothetical protein AVDCRST_MAG23-1879 [uncultured Sphingosinicella sp.]
MRFAMTALALAVPAAAPAQETSRTEINRIINEGLNQSQVMETAAHLTDRIGGRMTNSPQMREAERWTQSRFREWGLANVRAEPFEFGRGWSIVRASARMTAPRVKELRTIPVAWTPGTNGTITAPVVVAPIDEESDFAQWRGKLGGRIVLVSLPGTGSEPTEPAFKRYTGEELGQLNTYPQPDYSPQQIERRLKRDRTAFALTLDRFLKEEGALAWVRISYRDGGLVHGAGYTYRAGQTPSLPGFEMAAEDYRRLARLARTDAAPTLELVSDVRFHDEDTNAYNIIAEIPGTGRGSEYVMAGAHLDSWAGADGAVDNAAGSAVVMEAARLLRSLGVRPKRTIRFALWSGEEQGILGSLAYVDRYLASRPPETDPERARTNPNQTWRNRYPITPKPGHRDLVAYFNMDNGSGKFRGIYAEGNIAAVPIFQDWLAPFASMGATTVAARSTSGTDHVFMQSVGIPAYQFIQDPLDYGSRLHHTSIDTYDHLKAEDLRQAAVIMATFLLNAANRPEPLPRMPVPSQPRITDPFEYLDDDD